MCSLAMPSTIRTSRSVIAQPRCSRQTTPRRRLPPDRHPRRPALPPAPPGAVLGLPLAPRSRRRVWPARSSLARECRRRGKLPSRCRSFRIKREMEALHSGVAGVVEHHDEDGQVAFTRYAQALGIGRCIGKSHRLSAPSHRAAPVTCQFGSPRDPSPCPNPPGAACMQSGGPSQCAADNGHGALMVSSRTAGDGSVSLIVLHKNLWVDRRPCGADACAEKL